MSEYNWSQNPFTFRIYPDLMIGYEDRHRRIRNSIASRNKFTLLVGETGAGKTNLLRSVERSVPGTVFYMAKPPITEQDLLMYLRDEVLQQGRISRWLRSYSLYNIHDAVNKKYDDQVVLLVDEGHEASTEVLEWLRTAIDHIDGMSVVAAGLPEFKDRLQDEVNTLYSRATDVVSLTSLDRDETIELIRKRIEEVGGSSTEPFTQAALLQVYEATDGFPRDVLRVCSDCVVTAADEGKTIIDEDDVRAVVDGADESSSEANTEAGGGQEREPALRRLTEKQAAVYGAVEENPQATSGEIVDQVGVEEYKSRSHAIRSVNNMLRRLMDQDLVTRERRGRNYLYSVAE